MKSETELCLMTRTARLILAITNSHHSRTVENHYVMMDSKSKAGESASNPALGAYLIFVASWLLHLPARIPILGILRFDLVLVAILAVVAISQRPAVKRFRTPTDKWLLILLVYSILTVPFVEWPGSVAKIGLPNFIKAIVFYYFTIAFVKNERHLKLLIFVFLTCQILRVLEPLYLNVTQGYFGSQASMEGGGEFLDRLSGGPYDVINPNGLAFIICTALSLLYFLTTRSSWKLRILLPVVASLLLYALALTGSRSGLIGLVIVAIGIVWKAKHKGGVVLVVVTIAAIGFAMLSADMQDRYLSIFGKGEKNAATADERVEGTWEQLHVVMHRPLFGHGLGTSAEANYHFTTAGPYGGRALPAHNLYIEVAQELGLVGLIIYLAFLASILRSFAKCRSAFAHSQASGYLKNLVDGMAVWLAMSLVFSFASYGLSSYDWYLFAGLAVVLERLRDKVKAVRHLVPSVAVAQLTDRHSASFTQPSLKQL